VGPAPTIKTGFVVVMLKLDNISGQNVNNNVDVTIGKSAAKWKMAIITFRVYCLLQLVLNSVD
jgi:hypothetical protein